MGKTTEREHGMRLANWHCHFGDNQHGIGAFLTLQSWASALLRLKSAAVGLIRWARKFGRI
jgi:hypothetical protein